MGFDLKSGVIARDFSAFLEKKLNTLFADEEIKLSRISGGVVSTLSIDDFNIYRRAPQGPPADAGTSPLILSVDRNNIKYNFVDLLLRRFERFGGIHLISPSFFFVPGQSRRFVLPPAGQSFCEANPVTLRILNGNFIAYGLGRHPILSNMEGSATFCNTTLILKNVKGNFLNLPVVVNGRIDNPLERPAIKLRLLIAQKYYTARFAVKSSGQQGEGAVWGVVTLLNGPSVHLKGKIRITSSEIIELRDVVVENTLRIDGDIDVANKATKFMIASARASETTSANEPRYIKVISSISQEKGLNVYTKLNHLNCAGMDVLSQINMNASIHKAEDASPILRGALKTQNLILDYRPFKDITASWVLKKDELFINTLELGDEYRVFGRIQLRWPYNVDLNLTVNNAELADWLSFSKSGLPNGFISGRLSGRLKTKGPIAAPVTKGSFEVRDGNIRDVRFRLINFNVAGKGPVLAVSDSRILKEGGYLLINGEIDLRKLGRRNIFEDLKIETDQHTIVWEGWDISKDSTEVRLKRQVSEDFDVNFKTYMYNEKTDGEQKENELGIDYKIRKDDSLNVRMKEGGAFVGVEHKIKF